MRWDCASDCTFIQGSSFASAHFFSASWGLPLFLQSMSHAAGDDSVASEVVHTSHVVGSAGRDDVDAIALLPPA